MLLFLGIATRKWHKMFFFLGIVQIRVSGWIILTGFVLSGFNCLGFFLVLLPSK